MPERYFRFRNPYTGTTSGSGDGSSFGNPSGSWTYFLDVIDDSGNTGNIVWVNSDAYLGHNAGDVAGVPTNDNGFSGSGASRFLYGDRPGSGTLIRLYETGNALARKQTHMLFDGMSYSAQDGFAGAWSNLGDGRWQRTFGTFGNSGRIRAVWACNGEVRGQNGDNRWELCHRASAATCTVVGDWFSADSSATSQVLTINTGNSTGSGDPDTVFGGICFQWYDSNRSWALQMLGVQRITWERPLLMGGGFSFGGLSNVACEDLTFLDPNWTLQSGTVGGNFVLNNDGTGANVYSTPMRRIRFVRPKLRRKNANSLAKRVDSQGLVALDHFYFRGYVSDVSMVNPDFESRMTHGIVSVYNDVGYTPGDLTYPRNIEVYGESRTHRGRLQGPSGTDAHLCYGRLINCQTEGMVSFRNLDLLDNRTQAQLSGRVRLEGCYLRGGLYQGYDASGNDNKAGSVVFFGESADLSDIPVVDIEVNDCVIESPAGSDRYPIRTSTEGNATDSDHTKLRFNRCLVIDNSGPTKRARSIDGVITYGPDTPVISVRWTESGVAATWPQFRDCVFVTPTGNVAGKLLYSGGSWVPTSYTVGDLPTLNASSRNNMQFDTLEQAGMFDYRTLLATSDAARKGVGGAGTVDLNGRLRGVPHALGAADPA